MKPIFTTLLAIMIAGSGTWRAVAQDPFSQPEKVQKQEAKRDVFSTKVIIEKDGKEVASFTAMGSTDPDGKSLYCTGSVALFDTGLWRVNVSADLRSLEYSDVRIEVEDMKLLRKLPDNSVIPIQIFSTQLQSKGTGKYLFGEVQGMTVRVEISKEAAP